MSRTSVTYKPGGAVAKPLEMTLKMQRVTPVAKVQDCPVSQPASGCETPPLVAAWVDSFGNPLTDEVGLMKDVFEFVEQISEWCESLAACVITSMSGGRFMHVARLVNADFVSAGLSTPLFIDESLCSWDTAWDGDGYPTLITASGSSFAVAYDGNMGSGVLTITPYYDGAELPVLTLEVTANIYNNCA